MTEPTQWECPSCGAIVPKSDLIVTEMPSDYVHVDVSDLESIPERFRGTGAVKLHVRTIYEATDYCTHCHDRHLN
jgi:ribosomal protein S26